MRWPTTLLVALAGCGSPPPDPPSAVITLEPETLCEGDGFETPVEVSAKESSARLTLVPAPGPTEPLEYSWRFRGAAHEVVSGDASARDLTLVSEGDAPLHVELTVTNERGGRATAERSLSITPRGDAPDVPCDDDEDCGPCHRCAPESGECVSP